jgi:glycosyltransferase involved in cell wall biosynthesis
VKVVFHAVYYLPEYGGMESHLRDLAEDLASRGHVVTVVCGRSMPGLPQQETIQAVRVLRSCWFGRNPLGWALTICGSIPLFLRASRDADIVHAQDFGSALATDLARLLNGVPNVVTIHTSHFKRLSGRTLLAPFFRLLFAPVDHIFANDVERAQAAQALAPRIKVEPYVNAVNTDRFRPVAPTLKDPGRMILVCPARLAQPKGVEYAIRAMPQILSRQPCRLYLAGSGPLRAELEALARSLGVADDVRFLGKQPPEAMPGIYGSADVVLLPSLFEATSIAALEAMACERAMAVSRVGGLPQMVDDEVGALFEPANPADLAEKTLAVLGRDRAALGRRARQRVVEQWDTRRLTDRFLTVYTALSA